MLTTLTTLTAGSVRVVRVVANILLLEFQLRSRRPLGTGIESDTPTIDGLRVPARQPINRPEA